MVAGDEEQQGEDEEGYDDEGGDEQVAVGGGRLAVFPVGGLGAAETPTSSW